LSKFFDKKAKNNISRYILQCVLATVSILVLLLYLNLFTQTSIIASLGATTFIVFTMPSAQPTQYRNLIGGYFNGIIVGIIASKTANLLLLNYAILSQRIFFIILGSLAVGITILIMVITDTEHPPAVGMALSLVLSSWNYKTILFVFSAILLMSAIKKLLESILIDLT